MKTIVTFTAGVVACYLGIKVYFHEWNRKNPGSHPKMMSPKCH